MKTFFIFLIAIVTVKFCNCQKQNAIAEQQEINSINFKPLNLVFDNSAILKADVIKAFTYSDSIWGHPVFCNKILTKVAIHSSTFFIQSNKEQTLYFVKPGESVNIKLDIDNNLIFYIKGNEQRTNELNFFRILIKKFGTVYNFLPTQPYHKRVNSFNDIVTLGTLINETENKRLLFLDSFKTNNLISDYFFDVAKNTIQSAAIKDSLFLFWLNKDLLNKLNLYTQLVTEKLVTIKKIPFQPFLVYLKTCGEVASMASTQYLDYEVKDSADICNQFYFADSNFTGLAKDFLLSKTLYSAYSKQIPVSKDLLAKFYAICTDSGYRKIITQKINEKKIFSYSAGSNNLILSDNKTVKSLKSIIDSYKGKIVIIDLWASWCAPCRKEIPFSQDLIKKYSGKPIVYLYISTDENLQNWNDAVTEEGINKGFSFLLLNSNSSTLMQSNKIQTIPRYIIIGKNGEIINNDAPRPSETALKLLLDKLL